MAISDDDIAVAGSFARSLYDIDGSGIKIGVISNSFNATNNGIVDPADTAATLRLLPQTIVYSSAVTNLSPNAMGDNEGLAMMELVYQTAPGAQLYFASTENSSGITTTNSYSTAVIALQKEGCNIIVDDTQLSNESFFSYLGPLDQTIGSFVSPAVDGNYFSSAGNDGPNFYQANFNPITASVGSLGLVTVADLGNGNPFESFSVASKVGDATVGLQIEIQWQTPFSGALTLYIVDAQGNFIGPSQAINGDNFAYGTILSVPSIAVGDYRLIVALSGQTPPTNETFRFTFINTHNTIVNLNGPLSRPVNGDVYGHATLRGVNSVGAVDFVETPAYDVNPAAIEPFSEYGVVSFVAPDGASISVPGFDPFYGTSAAAPVAAAVAALMLQADPNLTNTQVTSYLKESAVAVNGPVDSPSANMPASNAGTGLIQADTALGLVEGNFQVSTEQEFDEAINAINQDSAVQNRSYTITLQSSLGLANPVPTLLLGDSSDLTIKGSGQTINLGGSALNFSQGPITIDSANLFNGGTISIAGQDLDLVDSSLYVGAIASSGAFDIQPTSTLAVTGVIASGSTIDFSGTGGTLKLSDPAGVAGAISDFLQGDTIDLAGVGLASDALLGYDNVLYVNGASGPIALQLDSGQDYSNDGFVVASDGSGGTDITVQPNTHDTNSPDGTSTTTTNDPSGTYTDSTTYSGPNGTGTALSRTITFYASNAVYQGGSNPPTGEFPNVDLTATPNLIVDIETETGTGYFGVNLTNMGIQSSIGVIAPDFGFTGEGFYSEYAGQLDWDNVPTTGSGIVFLPIGAITDAPIAEVGGDFTKTGSGNDESASGDYFLQTGLFSNESASSYSVSNVSATESPTGVGSITFTINRSGSSATAGIPLYYKIVSENQAGKSFNEPLQTPVTFLAGEMSRTITTDFLPITFQVSTGDMIGISVPVYAEYPVDYYPRGVSGTLFNYNDTETSELAQIAPACYFVGTALATFAGNRPVETLAIGDLMLTASGQLRPIKWIGRRGYMARFAVGRPALWPICLRAGSLGNGLPHRHLYVSGDHALFIDGLLIPAKQLVNGTTITRERPSGELHYFHIELETHDVLLAEGAPAETFLDDDSRMIFHNASEFAALYPDAGPPGRFCAPRVESGYELEAVRCRLNALAGGQQLAA